MIVNSPLLAIVTGEFTRFLDSEEKLKVKNGKKTKVLCWETYFAGFRNCPSLAIELQV